MAGELLCSKVAFSCTASSWWPVVYPRILLHTFSNGMDDGPEGTLSKFAANTKLAGVANAPERCVAIQMDPKGGKMHFISINKGK